VSGDQYAAVTSSRLAASSQLPVTARVDVTTMVVGGSSAAACAI